MAKHKEVLRYVAGLAYDSVGGRHKVVVRAAMFVETGRHFRLKHANSNDYALTYRLVGQGTFIKASVRTSHILHSTPEAALQAFDQVLARRQSNAEAQVKDNTKHRGNLALKLEALNASPN